MKHLSGLDATFLHLETPEMPMHVGSLNVLDLPKGYKGDFYEDAKEFMASRIHLADVFTRKLALMPFDMSNPVWVDDEDIDIDYHVRHITLPKPGTNRQLQQYVARLHSTLIDRSRPMWEFFIIDGLQSGQVALYTKVHHAGIDGQAGVEVGKAIFDLEATGRVVKPPRSRPRGNGYQLGMAELATAALRNTAQQYVKLFKMAPAIARAIGGLAKPDEKAAEKAAATAPKKFNLFAPRTSLNVSITNQRTFAGRTISLAETKYVAKHFGVSLNDVVMATVAGALRHYLADNNELPAKPLVAGVPVSLREAGDDTANNQASMILVSLATDITDPDPAAEGDQRVVQQLQVDDEPLQGGDPGRLPDLRRALAGVGHRLDGGSLGPGEPPAAGGQRGHLQRGGRAVPDVLRGRAGHLLLPGVDRQPRHGAQCDGAELQRPHGLRPHRLPPRRARHHRDRRLHAGRAQALDGPDAKAPVRGRRHGAQARACCVTCAGRRGGRARCEEAGRAQEGAGEGGRQEARAGEGRGQGTGEESARQEGRGQRPPSRRQPNP
jgi:WS/DGAT/MGAT family acyltransferase